MEYKPDILSMLSKNRETSLRAYREHLQYGRIGDLIFDPESPFSVRRFPEIITQLNGSAVMFDNAFYEWVPFDPDNVPRTYSCVPRPKSVLLELYYFRKTVGLVNHKYIWIDNPERGIHRDIFAKIANRTNLKFLGRFTVARNMPTIIPE